MTVANRLAVWWFFLVVLFAVDVELQQSNNGQDDTKHNATSDVVFIIDSSTNVAQNYDIIKQFIINIISRFTLSKQQTRLGLISAGQSANTVFTLSDEYNVPKYTAKIRNMPLKVDSHAELEPALKKAYEMMSDSQAGARSGVPKVLIILTASFNNETGKEMDYVRKLQQLGTSLISIGTGSSINPILLFQLPRNPSNSILIEDFNKLTDREQSENVVKRILKASEFRCFSEVDVGFILDSSGSLRNSYDKEKELLKRIAGTFVIGQNQARMSVVTFSYHASLSIKFSDYDGENDFFQAVDNIPLMGYTTRIDKALEMAKDSMFNEKNGARVGVPKILILLTDGSQSPSSDATDPAVLAKKIRNTGINLLAIGIGKGINQTELEHIVGSSQSTFQAASFDEITTSNFITKVASGSCRKAKEPPKPSCEAVVDVGFILDSSGSLRNEYGKEKNFLKSMATTFGISENGSRAGVVTFSYYTEHSIKLSDYTDLARFNEAVDRIPLMGRTTRIDKALRVAQKDLFSISNGGRPGVPKILILLTDGSQTPDADAEEPGDIADELRKQGITILVVGIGSGVNSTELAHIAGKTDNVFSAASFDQLVGNEFVDKIKEGGCAAASIVPTTAIPLSLPRCDLSNLDAVFAVDMSISSLSHHNDEKRLLKVLTESIASSSRSNNIALVSYGGIAQVSIQFQNTFNATFFSETVDKITPIDNGRRLDNAIIKTYEDLFKPRYSGTLTYLKKNSLNNIDSSVSNNLFNSLGQPSTFSNSQIPFAGKDKFNHVKNKLFVVLIAGKHLQNGGDVLPRDAARLLHDLGIQILVVAFDETSKDAKEIVYNKGDVHEFYKSNNISDVWFDICHKFTKKKVSYTCEGPVDVAFLLDSSASMFYDYQLQSEFVGKLAKKFNISPAGAHATILIYSHTAQMKGTLKDGANMTGLTKALGNLPFLGGDTRFDRGLYLSRLALFDPKFGARSKVPKVLFVVTDGEQSSFVSGSSPVDLAEELHELGVHVIALAVGGAVNKKEVQTMASSDDSVFFVKNFIELSSEETIKKLWNHSCSNLRASEPFTKGSGDIGITLPGIDDNVIPDSLKVKMMCPIEKDMQLITSLMNSGMKSDWIANFVAKTGSLSELLRYYRTLNTIMGRLGPAFSRLGENTVIESSYTTTCKSGQVNDLLSRMFSDKEEDDLFATSRKNGAGYFVDLLWATGLANDILTSTGRLTLIVPTDSSFKQLPKSMKMQMKDTCFLRKLLLFHISKEITTLRKLKSSQLLLSVDKNKPILYNSIGKIQSLGGSIILSGDIISKNGIIHVVDKLMIPPERYIATVISSSPNFLIAKRGLEETLLKEELLSISPYTIFLPYDNTTTSERNLHDVVTLRRLLRRHVVKGVVFTNMVPVGESLLLKSLSGDDITLRNNNGVVTLNEKIKVTQNDVRAIDGVIHVVDGVLN